MGENARFENGHARVDENASVSKKKSEASLSIGRQRVGAF